MMINVHGDVWISPSSRASLCISKVLDSIDYEISAWKYNRLVCVNITCLYIYIYIYLQRTYQKNSWSVRHVSTKGKSLSEGREKTTFEQTKHLCSSIVHKLTSCLSASSMWTSHSLLLVHVNRLGKACVKQAARKSGSNQIRLLGSPNSPHRLGTYIYIYLGIRGS